MEKFQYKDYVIDPRVLPLQDGTFGVEVLVEEHTGPTVNVNRFFFENTFETEQEAHDHATVGGRRMIDEGRV